ncbi:hypothetical protein ACLMJK_002741 [Lecanora helva]
MATKCNHQFPEEDNIGSAACSLKDAEVHHVPPIQRVTKIESEESETMNSFRKFWRTATDANCLTLFGFRRFRTAHLLNLRFLEEEIDTIDHDIFQAGIRISCPSDSTDRLGLAHAKRDAKLQNDGVTISQDTMWKLRKLLKEYGRNLQSDDALASFNNIMMMETFALADNSAQASQRTDFDPYETYKTRLIRVDLARRNSSRDIIQHSFRKCLRYFWFYIRRRGHSSNASSSALEANLERSYQNTARIAEFMTRLVVAVLAGAFLIFPLVILSLQTRIAARLTTVSLCIVIFSLVVSIISKASNEQTMAATAGYAAVLAVFLSNNPSA